MANTDTVETVKRLILFTLRWVFSQPRDLILVLGGGQLDDARTLQECGITSGTQITMIMRLRGGMQRADDSEPFDEDFGTDSLDDIQLSTPEVSETEKIDYIRFKRTRGWMNTLLDNLK